MLLGLFGGSFDPVHRGHLTLAQCCRQQARLDQVWFVPTAHQPFKPTGPYADDSHRIAMLRLALDGHDDFVLSTLEIERGGMSYTIDTLLAIQSQMLDVELYLLMGADSLADFPFWRRPADICRIATPLVVSRAGEPLPHFEHLEPFVSPERLSQIASLQVNMPPQPIRSSDIRSLVASGGEWDAMVPEPVAHYIRKHRLYETTDRGR